MQCFSFSGEQEISDKPAHSRMWWPLSHLKHSDIGHEDIWHIFCTLINPRLNFTSEYNRKNTEEEK